MKTAMLKTLNQHFQASLDRNSKNLICKIRIKGKLLEQCFLNEICSKLNDQKIVLLIDIFHFQKNTLFSLLSQLLCLFDNTELFTIIFVLHSFVTGVLFRQRHSMKYSGHLLSTCIIHFKL